MMTFSIAKVILLNERKYIQSHGTLFHVLRKSVVFIDIRVIDIIMKIVDKLNWEDKFSNEVINQSFGYMNSIVEVIISEGYINANLQKSTHFHVSIHIKDNEITYMFCTCGKDNCKHQAAVLRYVEENNLLEKESDFLDLIKTVDDNHLREYFINVLNENPVLKEDFIRKFKKEPKIDSKPYFDKLKQIIEKSKGKNYYDFGYYDIDVLADEIHNFLCDEIFELMGIHQYEVVFELLDSIADVLNDEMYVDNDNWYYACDEYLQIAYSLEETYVLSDEQLDKLECNTSFMRKYI